MLKKRLMLVLVLVICSISISSAVNDTLGNESEFVAVTNDTLNFTVENELNLNGSVNISSANVTNSSDNLLPEYVVLSYEIESNYSENLTVELPLNSTVDDPELQVFVILQNNSEDLELPLESPLVDSNETLESSVESYYVEIGSDAENDSNISVIEGAVLVDSVELGSYVSWVQTLSLSNNLAVPQTKSINLLDFESSRDYYEDSSFVLIYSEGSIVSDTFAFYADLELNQTKDYLIEYYTSPIDYFVNCHEESLFDLIPAQAKIISVGVDMHQYTSTVCDVELEFDTNLNYSGLKIPVSEIVEGEVDRIYSVDQGKYIDFGETFEVS